MFEGKCGKIIYQPCSKGNLIYVAFAFCRGGHIKRCLKKPGNLLIVKIIFMIHI